MKRPVYLIQRGWVTEDKRTGLGDGEIADETFAPSIGEARRVFESYKNRGSGTDDRGSYWARDVVAVYVCDENDEFSGQPILEFRSPIPEAAK